MGSKRRLREQADVGDLTPSQTAVLLRLEKDGQATTSSLARAEPRSAVTLLDDAPHGMTNIMPLDLSPLTGVVAGLREGLARYHLDPSDTQIRDGLIQRFEFTYDLAHKMLRRTIEAGAANPEDVDRMTFPTLIRTGFEQRLGGSDWSRWRIWREMRNITSHTYDEEKALAVAVAIPNFLAEAEDLPSRLMAQASA